MNRSPKPSMLALVTVTLGLLGCRSDSLYTPDPAAQAAALAQLRTAGPWSQPMAGLRCRLLLPGDQTMETSFLPGAMVIENTTNRTVTLTASSSPPFGPDSVHWRVDDAWLPPSNSPAANASKSRTEIAPGTQLVLTSPLRVPAGPGARQVSAAFVSADGQELITPPVAIQVAAAEWGTPADGLRLRLSCNKSRYLVGENVILYAFVHNLARDPVNVHPVDTASIHADVRPQLVILKATTIDAASFPIQGGQTLDSQVPSPPLLAPGEYRLRLEIDSPELSVAFARAWHGLLISNEVPIQVVAP